MGSLPKGWVLLNTDGVSKGNLGTAAGGDVIRGEWLSGFTENVGTYKLVKAEVGALWPSTGSRDGLKEDLVLG